MIVVASAGNDGDVHGATGRPGSLPHRQPVSSRGRDNTGAIIDGFAVSPPIPAGSTVHGNASVAFNWPLVSPGSPEHWPTPPGNRSGCSAFGGADAAAIAGKVALLDWVRQGRRPRRAHRSGRVLNAFNSGAVGVVFAYHLTPGDFGITGRVKSRPYSPPLPTATR